NEAWYEDAQELDQMVAFSRMHALCTGRSFVRCANSGVSCAIGPDGAELARLRVGESDRQVRGTLVVDVPVPTSPAALGRTPYIWLQPWLLPLGALLPLLALLFLHLRVRMVGQEA
ncbi:MAG: apolipoprotein N-acyltransferase, partial [Candidatus Paceibacteria bacterium]